MGGDFAALAQDLGNVLKPDDWDIAAAGLGSGVGGGASSGVGPRGGASASRLARAASRTRLAQARRLAPSPAGATELAAGILSSAHAGAAAGAPGYPTGAKPRPRGMPAAAREGVVLFDDDGHRGDGGALHAMSHAAAALGERVGGFVGQPALEAAWEARQRHEREALAALAAERDDAAQRAYGADGEWLFSGPNGDRLGHPSGGPARLFAAERARLEQVAGARRAAAEAAEAAVAAEAAAAAAGAAREAAAHAFGDRDHRRRQRMRQDAAAAAAAAAAGSGGGGGGGGVPLDFEAVTTARTRAGRSVLRDMRRASRSAEPALRGGGGGGGNGGGGGGAAGCGGDGYFLGRLDDIGAVLSYANGKAPAGTDANPMTAAADSATPAAATTASASSAARSAATAAAAAALSAATEPSVSPSGSLPVGRSASAERVCGVSGARDFHPRVERQVDLQPGRSPQPAPFRRGAPRHPLQV